jgi:Ser/Thr protein kinase RdoA (MazF antagonist)
MIGSESSGNTPADLELLRAEARHIAEASTAGQEPQSVRSGPYTFIYASGELDTAHEPRLTTITRLSRSDPPATGKPAAESLAAARTQHRLVHHLIDYGAQLQPWRNEPEQIGNFIVTQADYLPGKIESDADYYQFGAALASLHTAGYRAVNTRPSYPVHRFDPLAQTRQTYEYLQNLRAQTPSANLLAAGNSVLTSQHLEMFGEAYRRAAQQAATLHKLADARGQLTVLHHDVHPGNARLDSSDHAQLFDFEDLSIGPAAYDFGRPLGQWTPRFGWPPSFTDNFKSGYQANVAEQLSETDPEQLALAEQVASVRFGLSVLGHAAEAHRAGQAPDEWTLAEGLHRLANLDDPNASWHAMP